MCGIERNRAAKPGRIAVLSRRCDGQALNLAQMFTKVFVILLAPLDEKFNFSQLGYTCICGRIPQVDRLTANRNALRKYCLYRFRNNNRDPSHEKTPLAS